MLKKKNVQKAVEAMKQYMLEEEMALLAALEKEEKAERAVLLPSEAMSS